MKTTYRFATAAALLTITSLIAGCPGDDGTDSLTQEQADLAFSSVSEVLDSAQDAVASQTAASAALDFGVAPVSATVPCPGGGTAAVEGEVLDLQELSLTVDFAGCVAGTLTIDGSVDSLVQLDVTGVSQSAIGELSFSGAFEATCPLDLLIERGIASVSVSGSICGVIPIP